MNDFQKSQFEFQVGDGLWSTCGACFYGFVTAVGHDDNNTPTIDIEITDPQDLIGIEGCGNNPEWPDYMGLTELVVPEGVKLSLKNVQYKIDDFDEEYVGRRDGFQDKLVDTGYRVECLTPGDGCYRCIKHFWIKRPVAVPQS